MSNIGIENPILKGFNPDPSILRVGDDYYIATSTFEWYPGVQIHHSRDLIHWDPSPLNPILRASATDKLVANPNLTESQRARIAHAVNLNNSDIDFCEWQGRLVINYSWGNQQGVEHLAQR